MTSQTLGMTVADWWGVTSRKPNATFMGDIDAALREVSDKLREVPDYPDGVDEPVIADSDEENREKSLQWLLDMDLSEPEEAYHGIRFWESFGDLAFVRDHEDRFPLGVQPVEHFENHVTGGCIEVSGGFVREKDQRVVYERPSDGGALLLTPGFVTDATGLLLLFPPTRVLFRRLLKRRFKIRAAHGIGGPSGRVIVRGSTTGGGSRATRAASSGSRRSPSSSRTCSAVVGLTEPKRLAEGAAKASPDRSRSACARARRWWPLASRCSRVENRKISRSWPTICRPTRSRFAPGIGS